MASASCGRSVLNSWTKSSKRACCCRLFIPGGRVASFFSVRCMRSWQPFCCGWPGLMRSMAMPSRSNHTESLERLKRPFGLANGTPLSDLIAWGRPRSWKSCNDLWCADFKGEFKLGNGRYSFPLTVTDHASRFLLLCEALESTRENLAITAFEQLFQERGLPQAIRSDNGVPFASPNGLFNLSKLSVWWLRLGIAIERIKPGHPQQNGRHERIISH